MYERNDGKKRPWEYAKRCLTKHHAAKESKKTKTNTDENTDEKETVDMLGERAQLRIR